MWVIIKGCYKRTVQARWEEACPFHLENPFLWLDDKKATRIGKDRRNSTDRNEI